MTAKAEYPGDPATARKVASPVRGGAMSVLADARRGHAGLFWFAVSMGLVAVGAVVGVLVDDRVLLGAAIWLKPLKFSLSFGLYALALAWILSLVGRGRRTGGVVGWIIVVGSAIEVAIVVVQVVRGTRSHFNDDTPFDTMLFSIMGATVALIWLATLALAVVVLSQRPADRAAAWSVRLGLLVALAGMAVGVIMSMQPGIGSHSVGVPDGGPGLPLFGWSTTGGDLRVGHFIGMHALQVLPLLAAALTAVPGLRHDGAVRLRLVLVSAGTYLGLVALLTWQALRGQPLLSPDPATLAALGVLLAAGAGSTALILAGHRAAGRPT
jgi:hypothetical protein